MDKQFEETCPKCNSDNLEYGSVEPVDEEMSQKVYCTNCDHNFTIWSKVAWVYEVEE